MQKQSEVHIFADNISTVSCILLKQIQMFCKLGPIMLKMDNMLRQNIIRFYKGLYADFILAPEMKKIQNTYRVIAL